METNSQRLKWILLPIIGAFLVLAAWLYLRSGGELLIPGRVERIVELPYAKLSFSRLAERESSGAKIEIGRVIQEQPEYTSYMFYYESDGKKISGQLNLPNLSRTMSAVVMARGYIPKEGYTTGLGTRNAAAVYAKNGYITLAPDFLGYGESDMEDTDSIGARLYRPVEILDLLAALPTLPQLDTSEVYLWGHSNGGQIMLSVVEILGLSEARCAGRSDSQCVSESDDQNGMEYGLVKILGMTLWAPVSKPFPFSILAFSDEAEDQGKLLRKAVSNFEKDYDVYNYSIDRYWDAINIPMLLHQGTADDAVPYWWSDSLAEKLEELDKDLTYHKYPGADHNMRPVWDTVVARDLQFFENLR